MHPTAEIFDASDGGIGGHAEDGGEVTEPENTVCLEVPVPAPRVARFHGQLQPVVGDVALGFRTPVVGHVEADAHITDEGAVRIESWRGCVDHASVLAVMPPKPEFPGERFATIEGVSIGIE